jgi:hypothetical protein
VSISIDVHRQTCRCGRGGTERFSRIRGAVASLGINCVSVGGPRRSINPGERVDEVAWVENSPVAKT